jgi:hypothetical protein
MVYGLGFIAGSYKRLNTTGDCLSKGYLVGGWVDTPHPKVNRLRYYKNRCYTTYWKMISVGPREDSGYLRDELGYIYS